MLISCKTIRCRTALSYRQKNIRSIPKAMKSSIQGADSSSPVDQSSTLLFPKATRGGRLRQNWGVQEQVLRKTRRSHFRSLSQEARKRRGGSLPRSQELWAMAKSIIKTMSKTMKRQVQMERVANWETIHSSMKPSRYNSRILFSRNKKHSSSKLSITHQASLLEDRCNSLRAIPRIITSLRQYKVQRQPSKWSPWENIQGQLLATWCGQTPSRPWPIKMVWWCRMTLETLRNRAKPSWPSSTSRMPRTSTEAKQMELEAIMWTQAWPKWMSIPWSSTSLLILPTTLRSQSPAISVLLSDKHLEEVAKQMVVIDRCIIRVFLLKHLTTLITTKLAVQ